MNGAVSTGTPVIDVHGLDAGYGGIAVVHDLSLRVDAGEVVVLLGPNGAGKTTTLLTLSGLLQPIGGSIEVLGESVGGVTPHRIARRGLAHVPEDRSLFFDLTVDENLRLGLTGQRSFATRGARPCDGSPPRTATAGIAQGRPALGWRAADARARPSAGVGAEVSAGG